MKSVHLVGPALVMIGIGTGCAAEISEDPTPRGNAGATGSGAFGGFGGSSGFGGSAGSSAGGASGSGSSGASGATGASGSSGSSGAAGASGSGAGGSGAQPNTAPGFTNLAPPMGEPFDPDQATTVSPAAPTGWNWYPVDGTMCRDGSPNGVYVHFTQSDKLVLYLEGGGACSNLGFCNFNPPAVDKVLSGDGQTVIGTAFGVVAGRQQPGAYSYGVLSGIFDTASAENPFKDWNMVYVPYCTGDVHFGTKKDGLVPGLTTPQQFVGYRNMQKFVGRIVPTFKDKVNRVVITGASAGSFGAALNFSMVQDAFGSVRVDALLDSGAPFSDKYMPPCMQKRWREIWGFDDSLPPDCKECRQADGGGFIHMADFLIKKHPVATIAAISAIHDEVIRLFFSVGVKNCAGFDTADPVGITMGQILDPTILYGAPDYEAGMLELRTLYKSTNRFATFFMGGMNETVHQHIFRARFTDPAAGSETIASFTKKWLDGQFDQIGP